MAQEHQDQQRVADRRGFLIVLLVLLTLLLLGGVWFYQAERTRVRSQVEQDLMTIESLKVAEITRWRADRLSEIVSISELPSLRRVMPTLIAGVPSAESSAVIEWLGATSEQLGYAGAAILDTDSQVIASTDGTFSFADQVGIETSNQARDTGTALIADLHTGVSDSGIHMSVVAPIRSVEDDLPVGTVVAYIDPEVFLYPLIQSWPTSSRTAETLLVERNGDDAIFLNDLRHVSGAALSLMIPSDREDIPAIMAINGEVGIVEGVDYRDVPVIAAIEPIPDSPWYMIAKIDTQEAFAAWHARALLILGSLLALGLLSIATVAAMWQRAHSGELQVLLESERAQRESEARYQTTLMSVGDGVIVADSHGVVQLLNPVSAELTGWTLDDARGRPVGEVFRVVSEQTGQRVDRPITAVLGTGRISSLPDNVVLVARDGTRRPVADSSAPIRDADGQIVGMVLVFRDQTEERAAQREIAEAIERLENAEAHAVLGSWEYSLTTGEGWWSAQMYALTLCDVRAGVPHLQEFFQFVNPADRELVKKRMSNPAKNDSLPFEFRLRSEDGLERWVSASIRVEREEGGSPVVIAGTLLDVTRFHEAREQVLQLNRTLELRVEERTAELESTTEELQSVNEELLSMNEELQTAAEEIATINEDLIEASEAKTRFLRAMSHELRTPLNSIIGFSDILSRGIAGTLNDEQRRQLEMIHHSGNHLLALINDILDLSRVEAGKLELIAESIDVESMVSDVIQSVTASAHDKGLDLKVSLPEVPKIELVSDCRRVEQILINLLGNAVKFTDEGSVTLVVERPATQLVSFSVIDTGPGISPEDQAHIFGEFTQVSSDDPSREGTGLGLAISRGLAQALGGSLTVSSRLGRGSTFVLVLPREHRV